MPGLWAESQRRLAERPCPIRGRASAALVGALLEGVFDAAIVRPRARAASLAAGLGWVKRASPVPD